MPEPERLSVVLDTNVLFPPTLRDFLLCAAVRGVYRPHWSADILAELHRNLVLKADLTDASAARLLAAMGAAFPDALVSGNAAQTEALPVHPKDRHVLAAAIAAAASIIVTENVKDFPAEALEAHGVQAWRADAFLCYLLRAHHHEMMAALSYNATRLRRPPMSSTQLAGILALHAPEFARSVLEAL